MFVANPSARAMMDQASPFFLLSVVLTTEEGGSLGTRLADIHEYVRMSYVDKNIYL